MAWVVDTSVLLDIHLADPMFAKASAGCLAAHAAEGLILSPVTYIELAPAFDGDAMLQEKFLAEVGVEWPASWTLHDTEMAHRLWAKHIARKRTEHTAKRPVADILIESFAKRFQGLITRNPKRFTGVKIVVP